MVWTNVLLMFLDLRSADAEDVLNVGVVVDVLSVGVVMDALEC